MTPRLFFPALLLTFALVSCHSATPPAADTLVPDSGGIAVNGEADGVTITGIHDLENTMPVDLFKATTPDSLLKELAPDGSFQSAINVYLAVTDEHTVLFDTGLGADNGGKMLNKLAALHVRPEDVDAIFLTHLHAWSDNGPMASQNALWRKVLESYALRVQPFNDGDRLLDGLVVARLAPGHTPGHTVYIVDNCLIAGDLLHAQDLQLLHPECCARYDNNPTQAIATRKEILKYTEDSGLYLCGAHCYEMNIWLGNACELVQTK